MSNYPTSLDDDSSLPAISSNITELGGEAINALRDAMFAVEGALGLNPAGTMPSLAARLGVFINSDGYPNTSILYSLGLVTLPITNDQIAVAAGIPESKLTLDYRTQDLFNYIRDLSRDVNLALGWISTSGVKLEPHLIGAIYRHDLAQIDVAEVSSQFLNNVFRTARNNTDAYTLINDINNELLAHQWADGSTFGTIQNIITNNGSVYPSSYAHVASGIFLDTAGFSVIPQTAQSVQAFADYIDGASILTLGTRIQNLYSNGISRNSQSSSLTNDGYGQAIIPTTPAIAFLRGTGNNSSPVDSITNGDDIVRLLPSSDDGYSFDERFAIVQPGDIITVNYSGDGYNVAVPFVISERKFSHTGNSFPSYFVRIAGKNIAYSPHATVQITRSLFNNNKYGVLSVASAAASNASGNSVLGSITPSLIIGTPRGAQCTGVGFSPDQFNESHYLLYLALYPDGNPLDGYTFLPAIDVTGNKGVTPGAYTLDNIVAATNNAFRQPGFNYRFIAFQFEGEFGIMLADSIGNAGFSIVSAVVNPRGFYDQPNTRLNFPNNVVDVFPASGTVAPDPLGLGPFAGNLASPPFLITYGSIASALNPTKLFVPLKRNNYYVNGNEREGFPLDVSQAEDTFGDGYWVATILSVSDNAGPPGSVAVTYSIPLDLSNSGLKAGKTIVIRRLGTNFGLVNYGRYIIESVNFTPCAPVETQITVFDAVHAKGGSPYPVAAIGSIVGLYLSPSSVSFDAESATDFSPLGVNFKRHFEVFIDQNGMTFTHERGRISQSGTITVNGVTVFSSTLVGSGAVSSPGMDLVRIAPKLRGYTFGSVTKINMFLSSFNPTTGVYTGNLQSWDGSTATRPGPTISGRIGEIARFYDETNVDYVDIFFSGTNPPASATNQFIDIRLFPSLALDRNLMLLASCQQNTTTNTVGRLQDLRQFGNTSEEQLTTSALSFISAPARLTHGNGIIRGFDATLGGAYATGAFLSLTGGMALVNGNFLPINDQIFVVPALQENYLSTLYPINFALCLNDRSELVTIVLTDFDAALGTPSVLARVVAVQNAVSTNIYSVDSCSFSYLLNDRKDLCPLYIVSTTVSGSGNTATTTIANLRDVRKLARDADTSLPAVVTDDHSQGNFSSFPAAINWLSFNAAYQNSLQVKSAASITSSITFSGTPLNITGAGSTAGLTFTSGTTTVSNTTFTQIRLSFFGTTVLSSCNFNNVAGFFFVSPTISNSNFTGGAIAFAAGGTLTNCTFINCTVNFNFNSNPYSMTNCTFVNCTIIQNRTIATAVRISIIDCTVAVNVVKSMELGNNSNFQNSTFNWSVPTDGSYVSSDLINVGNAMFHTSLGNNAGLTNLTVQGCTFNVPLNSGVNRYGFFSFQFTQTSAYVRNINISSNQFLTSAPSGSNDVRAVIAFASMMEIPPTSQPITSLGKAPTMFDVSITNNYCNYDQMIAVTAARNFLGVGFNSIIGPLLSTIDCKISGNTCGTIGLINSSSLPYDTTNSALGGLLRNKTPNLLVENNTCKLITNLDNLGRYVTFRLTFPDNAGNSSRHDLVPISTGPATISGNTANWIQVGASSYGEYITYATITSASNGVALPTGTINVSSTLGFPASGTIIVFTSAGAQTVSYTGTSGGTAFTGVTGGTGTMSTGFLVTIVTPTFDGMIISDNILSPGNPNYLSLFADTGNGIAMPPGNYAICLRREFNGAGTTRSVIANNNIVQKTSIAAAGLSTITYYYDHGIVCLNSAVISDNSIVGCVNNSNDTNAAMLTLLNGNINATGNQFSRAGQTIGSYVYQPIPGSTSSANLVNITDNMFDSQFVDTANTIENPGNNLGLPWNFARNKNQVAFTSIHPSDFSWGTNFNSDIFGPSSVTVTSTPSTVFVKIPGPQLDTVDAMNWSVTVNSNGTNGDEWFLSTPLDIAVPRGAQLLYVMQGIEPVTATSGDTFVFTIINGNTNFFSTTNPQPNSSGSFNGSLATISNPMGTVVYTSNSLALTGTSMQYAFVNTTTGTLLYSGNPLVWRADLQLNSGDKVVMSPLMLKFKW